MEVKTKTEKDGAQDGKVGKVLVRDEIKEFKDRFFQIAEETSHQKNKINITF